MSLSSQKIALSIFLLSSIILSVCEQKKNLFFQEDIYNINKFSKNGIVQESKLKSSLTVENVETSQKNAKNLEQKGLLEELNTFISSALEIFEEKLTRAGRRFVENVLSGVLSQISQTKYELLEKAKSLDGQLSDAVNHINNSLINHSESIDTWATNIKSNLRSINDTHIYKQSCKVVDEFLNETTDELQRCCNVTIKPIISICHGFRSLFANGLRVLADVLHRMQICLEDKNSYSDYMIPCLTLAYDEFNTLVTDAANKLKRMELVLPLRMLYHNGCISVAVIHIEQRQHVLANDLLQNDLN